MPKVYQFTDDRIAELTAAKKANKNKNEDKRLKAILFCAQKVKHEKVAEKTGFCKQYITDLTAAYHNNGLSAIVENHYKGNHRNVSFEEEEKLLKIFEKRAENGQIIEVSDILRAYEEK